MATKLPSELELQVMGLRTKVLETALQCATRNSIKSPMAFVEELWEWVADVGQPTVSASQKQPKRMTKPPG